MSIIYRCRITAQHISVLFILLSYSFGHSPLTNSDNDANDDIDSRDTPNEVIREEVRRDISVSNIPKKFGIKHLNIFYDDDTFIQPNLNKRSIIISSNNNEQLPRSKRDLEEETIDIVHVDVENPDEEEVLVEGSDYNAAVARRDAEEEPIDVGQYGMDGLNGHMVDLLDENIFAAAKQQFSNDKTFQDNTEELSDDIHNVKRRNVKVIAPKMLSSIRRKRKQYSVKNDRTRRDGENTPLNQEHTKARSKRKKWEEDDDEDPIPGLPRGISEILDRTWTDYWKYFTKRNVKKRQTNLDVNPSKGMLLVEEPKTDKFQEHFKDGDTLNEEKINVSDVDSFGSVADKIRVSDDETVLQTDAVKIKKEEPRDTFKVLFSHDENGIWDNEWYGKKKKKKKKDNNVEDVRDESTKIKGYKRFRANDKYFRGGRDKRKTKDQHAGHHAEFHRPYQNILEDLVTSYHGEMHHVQGVDGQWTGQKSAHTKSNRLKKSLHGQTENTNTESNNERMGKRKKRDENGQHQIQLSDEEADLRIDGTKTKPQPRDTYEILSSQDEQKNKGTKDSHIEDVQDKSTEIKDRDQRRAQKSVGYPGQGARHRPYDSLLMDLMGSYHGEYHKAHREFGWKKEISPHTKRLKKSIRRQTENKHRETNSKSIGKRKTRDENGQGQIQVSDLDTGSNIDGTKIKVQPRDTYEVDPNIVGDERTKMKDYKSGREKRKAQKLVGYAGHDEHHAPFSGLLDDLISPYHGEFHSVHRVNSQWTGKKWANSKNNRLKKSLNGQTENAAIKTNGERIGKRKKRDKNNQEQAQNSVKELESKKDITQRDAVKIKTFSDKDTGVEHAQDIDTKMKDKRKAKEKPEVGYRGIDEHHKPFNSFWTGLMSPVHADFKNVHRIQHQFDGAHRGILGKTERDISDRSQTGNTETEHHRSMGKREKREQKIENYQGQGQHDVVELDATKDMAEREDMMDTTLDDDGEGEGLEIKKESTGKYPRNINKESTGRYPRKVRLLKSKKDDPHHRALYNMIDNIGINLISHESRHIPVLYPLVSEDEINEERNQIITEDIPDSKVDISEDETKQLNVIEKRYDQTFEDTKNAGEIESDASVEKEAKLKDLNEKRDRFKRKTNLQHELRHDPIRQQLQDLYDDIGPRRFGYPIFNKERWYRDATHPEIDKEASDGDTNSVEKRKMRHSHAPSYKTVLSPKSYAAQLDQMDDVGHHSHHHPMRGLFQSFGTHLIGQSMDFLPFEKIDSSDVEDLSTADKPLIASEPINAESRLRNKRSKYASVPSIRIAPSHNKPLRDLLKWYDPGIIHHIAHGFPFPKIVSGDKQPSLGHDFQDSMLSDPDLSTADNTLIDSEPISQVSRLRSKRSKYRGAPLGRISSQDITHHKPLRDLMNSVDPGIFHHLAHSFPFSWSVEKGDGEVKTLSGDKQASLGNDFQDTMVSDPDFTLESDKASLSDPRPVHGYEEAILPEESFIPKLLKKRNSEVEGYHHNVPPMDELDLDNALATFEHMFKDDITNKSRARHLRNPLLDYKHGVNLGQRKRRYHTGNHHIHRNKDRFIKSADFDGHSRRIGRQQKHGNKELHRRQSVGRLYGRHKNGRKIYKEKRSFSAGQEGEERDRRLTSMMEGNPLYGNINSDKNMDSAIERQNGQHDVKARSIHKFSLLEDMSPYSHIDNGMARGSIYVLNDGAKVAVAPDVGLYDEKKEPGAKPPALSPESFDDEEENTKYQALLNAVSNNAGFQQPDRNDNGDPNGFGGYYDTRLQKVSRIEYPEMKDKVIDSLGSFDFDRADNTDQQLRFSLNKKQERKKKSNELEFDNGASLQRATLQNPLEVKHRHAVVRRQGSTTEADSELTEMVMKQLGMDREASNEATTSFSAKKRKVKAKRGEEGYEGNPGDLDRGNSGDLDRGNSGDLDRTRREPFIDDDDLNHDDQNGIAERFVDMEKEAEDEIVDPQGKPNYRYKIARAVDADEGFHDVRIPILTQFYKTMNKGDNDYIYPYNATKYARSQEEKRKKMAILQELKDKNAYEEQEYATVIPLLTPYPSKPKNPKIYDLLNSLSEDDMGDNSVELIRSFYRTFPDEHNEYAFHHGPIVPRPPDYANKSISGQSGNGEEEAMMDFPMNQPPEGYGVTPSAVTNSYTQLMEQYNQEEDLLKEVAHNISHIRLHDPRQRVNWTSYVQRYQSEYKKNPINDTGKYVTQLNRSYPHVHDTLIDFLGSRNKAVKLFPLKSGESPPVRVDTGWAKMLNHENSHPYIKDIHPYRQHTAISNPLKKRDKEVKLNVGAQAFKKKHVQARDIETILKPFHRKVCHPSLLNLRPTIYLERRDIGATQIGKGSYFADVAYHTKSTKNGTKLQTGDYNLLYYFRHNVILTKILALDPEFSPAFESPTAQPLLWNLGFTISIHDFVTDRYGKKLHYTLPMQSYTLPSQPRAVAVLTPPIRADAIRFYPTPKVDDQMEWNWPNFRFKGCVIT